MAFNLPGTVLVGQLWWYGYAVFKPAQLMKSLGVLPRNELGLLPRAVHAGAGRRFSPQPDGPRFLDQATDNYHSVEEFDSLSHDYEVSIEPFSGPIFDETLATLRSLVPPDGRILDCSCGPGVELIKLAAAVPRGEAVGSDLSRGMVQRAFENARQRGCHNTAFFQADVYQMPAAFEASFDAIYCALSFHHYEEPLRALCEMRRVLRPEGKVFIVDAGPSWMKALGSPLAKWADPGWVAFRTGEEFRDLCGQAGFTGFYWTEILPGMGLTIATR
jgi:ubiquinone/menaquinone biosynthesis C-methylase UbiE